MPLIHDILLLLCSQAKAFFENGNFVESLKEFEAAHRVAVAIKAPDDSLAQLLNNLTLCCQKLGNWTDATDYCERSLMIRRNFQQESHTEYLKCSSHLANCYYHRKKFADAKRMYESVFNTTKEKLGPSHADTLRAMHNIGLMAFHNGNKRVAVSTLTECLELRTHALGACLLRRYRAIDNGSCMISNCLRLGPSHPDTRSTQNALNGIKNSSECVMM